MKSEMDINKKVKEKTYPYLGHSAGNHVVLFFKPNSGTVVWQGPGSSGFGLGYYTDEWHEENFQQTTNTILLSND